MTLSAERLNGAKKDIASAVTALETGDDSDISPEGRRLVDEFGVLGDAEWDPLLASLEDKELHDHVCLLRQKVSEAKALLPATAFSRIRQVRYQILFDLSQPSLLVRLRFNREENRLLLESSQDLEDTLWIGAAVLEVVSGVMQKMEGALSPEVQRDCIGRLFKEHLELAENAVGEIRRAFSTVSEADTP